MLHICSMGVGQFQRTAHLRNEVCSFNNNRYDNCCSIPNRIEKFLIFVKREKSQIESALKFFLFHKI